MKKTGQFFLARNSLQLGLVLGLVTPVIVFVLIYFLRFSAASFEDYVHLFFHEKQIVTFFGVWCLVGNIALFTYYINTRKDSTAKGIFALTLLYGIGVLVLKLFI